MSELSRREAFKVGFLRRCAERGLTVAETEKVAEEALSAVRDGDLVKEAKGWMDVVTKPVDWFLKKPLMMTLLGTPAIGAGLGYTMGRSSDVDESDIENIKREELINMYRAKKKQLQQVRQYGIPQVS